MVNLFNLFTSFALLFLISSNAIVLAASELKTMLEFQEFIHQPQYPIVVVQFETRCPECLALKDFLLEQAYQHPKLAFAEITGSYELGVLFGKYQIKQLPSTLIFIDGQLNDKIEGFDAPRIDGTLNDIDHQ